jgi:hypothetical protein
MACHLDGRLHAAPGDLVFSLRVERFDRAPAVDGRVQEYQYIVPSLARPSRKSAAGRMGAERGADAYAETGWSKRYRPEDAPGSAAARRGFRQPLSVGAQTVGAAAALQGVRRAPRAASVAAVAPAAGAGAAGAMAVGATAVGATSSNV